MEIVDNVHNDQFELFCDRLAVFAQDTNNSECKEGRSYTEDFGGYTAYAAYRGVTMG